MRTTSLLRLGLGAMVFSILMKPAVPLWAGEPVRLTMAQMNAITAGAVAVGTNAFATAGNNITYPTSTSTYTYTSTYTTVISEPSNTVQMGLGFGSAVAYGGSGTQTYVQSTYYAEGERVMINNINTNTTMPGLSYSSGFTSVITVGSTSPQY